MGLCRAAQGASLLLGFLVQLGAAAEPAILPELELARGVHLVARGVVVALLARLAREDRLDPLLTLFLCHLPPPLSGRYPLRSGRPWHLSQNLVHNAGADRAAAFADREAHALFERYRLDQMRT